MTGPTTAVHGACRGCDVTDQPLSEAGYCERCAEEIDALRAHRANHQSVPDFVFTMAVGAAAAAVLFLVLVWWLG